MARWLGFQSEDDGAQALYRLAFHEEHIGNPLIRAIHGGVIAAFLETAMQRAAAVHAGAGVVSTVNFAIDYLASSRAEDMTARVRSLRIGRRIAFFEATGWQGDESRPVAVVRAVLRLGGPGAGLAKTPGGP